VLDDYEVVAARAFAEPYAEELRALVRVCGDHFEQHGDPRGTLIALGEARYDATGARAHELQIALDSHVLAHHAGELGALVDVLRAQRFTLDWRAGLIFGARLDVRRFETAEVRRYLNALLTAPAARALRRLVVRVSRDRDIAEAHATLQHHEPRPPLEHVSILKQVRPRRLAGWETSGGAALGQARYPLLHFYAQDEGIYALMPHGVPVERALADLASPLDDADRTALGRALTSPDALVRETALTWLAAHPHDAVGFLDLLALLLQPNMMTPQLPVLGCMAAMGRAARRARPVIAAIPGRAHRYDRETRRAAGAVLAALDSRDARGS
jgi:hypothetical protein